MVNHMPYLILISAGADPEMGLGGHPRCPFFGTEGIDPRRLRRYIFQYSFSDDF